ncbi:MAG: hypothetical protein K6F70_06090 [Eggerthellaceae bacterium]|nr:hypothetical protein [Eggerthellaceae bacterium]
MQGDEILFDPRFMYVVQRMSATTDLACLQVTALSLGEYAMLLRIAEAGEGLLLHELEHEFGFVKTPQYLISILEEKELVRRVRSRSDKRAFACEVSSKGRARIALVDEAIAVSLVGSNPDLCEEDLGALIDQFQAIARFDAGRHPTTMFPSVALVALFKYRQLFERACSVAGILPLQMALLCILSSRDIAYDLSSLSTKTALFDFAIEFQLKAMMRKGLVLYEEGYLATGRGVERMNDLVTQFSVELGRDFAQRDSDVQDAYRNLAGYMLYLFE